MTLKIVCISDSHDRHENITITNCDVLIHTGDFTKFGGRKDVTKFAEWFAKQPARFKVTIPGNHDKSLEKYPEFGPKLFGDLGVHYLCDSGVAIEGIKFYGTPWTPQFGPWAFMRDRGSVQLKERFDAIPSDTEILLTHGPPYGYGDANIRGQNVGCELLLERIKQIKPKLHCCGHIHEKYGVFYTDFGTTIVNSSQVNLFHQVVNKPIELIWNY